MLTGNLRNDQANVNTCLSNVTVITTLLKGGRP